MLTREASQLEHDPGVLGIDELGEIGHEVSCHLGDELQDRLPIRDSGPPEPKDKLRPLFLAEPHRRAWFLFLAGIENCISIRHSFPIRKAFIAHCFELMAEAYAAGLTF